MSSDKAIEKNDQEIIKNLDFLEKMEALENNDIWEVLENIQPLSEPDFPEQEEDLKLGDEDKSMKPEAKDKANE